MNGDKSGSSAVMCKVLKGLVFLVLAGLLACSESGNSKFSAYQGQWLLINYWAVWCKPCIEEIPELNALNAREDVTVLGYNFDRATGAALQEQVAHLKIAFDLIAADPAPGFEQPSPQALPATMLISPEGEFVTWMMGPQTQEGILKRIVDMQI